ncbi:tRNA(adenine34) deaminase [Marasmius tenuissimus]|nr:tRNA(adenine34) deaminase [Marasmius tenuissimus]
MSKHDTSMKEAMNMAEEAPTAGEIPVGCVFVRDGKIIAKARNRTNELRNATRHAELEAIDQMLYDKELTPRNPTSSFNNDIILFYGCGNGRFGGCGSVLGVNKQIIHPNHPSHNATGGFRREEAIMVLRRFYITEKIRMPLFPGQKQIGFSKLTYLETNGCGATRCTVTWPQAIIEVGFSLSN